MALNNGFDVSEPMTNPNAFLVVLATPALRDIVRFRCFYASPFEKLGHGDEEINDKDSADDKSAAANLDIVLTSATSIVDEHSIFCKERFASVRSRLVDVDRCRGDILWSPLGPLEPIAMDAPHYAERPRALIKLTEVPVLIRSGRQVVLTIGPCGKCGRFKSDILEVILAQREHVVTHVVADRESVAALLVKRRGSLAGIGGDASVRRENS